MGLVIRFAACEVSITVECTRFNITFYVYVVNEEERKRDQSNKERERKRERTDN